MACVPACPSGVQYDRLIETTRAHIERAPPANARRAPAAAPDLRGLPAPAPSPRRARVPAPAGARRRSRRSRRRAAVAQQPPGRPSICPGRGRASRSSRAASQSVVFGDVNAATARVLAADGYDVHVPKAQGCCGALHAHAGRLDEGIARAQALADELDGLRHDRHERSRLRLAPEGPRHPERRRRLGAARRPAGACRAASARARVAFQDSCHLAARPAHRVASRARRSQAIPGLELLEPGEQDLCCGSAGIYNLVQPEAARELGDRKAEHVLATEPEAYASGNPGCLVQVTAALRRAGKPVAGVPPGRARRRVDPRTRCAGGAGARRAASECDAQGSSPETSTSP